MPLKKNNKQNNYRKRIKSKFIYFFLRKLDLTNPKVFIKLEKKDLYITYYFLLFL